MPRFKNAKGPKHGFVGSGNTKAILGIGDSIIAGVGASVLEKALVGQTAVALASGMDCSVAWRAEGMSGATTAKIHARLLPRVSDEQPDLVVLSAGVNDILALKRSRAWQKDLGGLLDALQENFPEAWIAIVGMPPLHGFPLLPQPFRALIGMRGRTFDSLIASEARRRPRCVHVALDFEPEPKHLAEDGFHPSESSYTAMGVEIVGRLQEEQESEAIVSP